MLDSKPKIYKTFKPKIKLQLSQK